MKKHVKTIDLLFKLAQDANDQKMKFASCIFYQGEIISFGFNQNKSHPFQAKFRKNSEAIFWHSECNAIFNALKKITSKQLMDSTLYVVRAKNLHGTDKTIHGLAKPCEGCMKAIKAHNIGKVIYTEDSPEELIYTTMLFNNK